MNKQYFFTTATIAFLASFMQVGCVMECEHHDKDNAAHQTSHVISDSAITTAVKSKYFTDPQIEATRIHVKTVDGVVTLTGNVPTQSMRDLAISVAQDAEGVRRVNPKLRIRP